MTRAALFVTILALAACGVDGKPVPPPPKPTTGSGGSITITGDARVGATARL